MNTPYQEKARLQELLKNLTHANTRLKESLALEPTRIHKDATIQRFEFTVELSWKTMQSGVRFMGQDALSPRDAIRVCARIELIADPESWLSMLTARNLTTHVYREEVADDVYTEANKLPNLVDDLLKRVTEKINIG